MKYLLLFLLSFNLYADKHRIHLSVTDSSGEARRTIIKDTVIELNNKVAFVVERVPALNYEWKEEIHSSGITKQILNGDTQEVITYYLHPINFIIDYKNITNDIAQEEAKKPGALLRKNLKDNGWDSLSDIQRSKIIKHLLRIE